ncbi:MAG: 16S rRNA (guanine(527)-N(7))-methyltransferase RsmG [Mycoplasma sp.]
MDKQNFIEKINQYFPKADSSFPILIEKYREFLTSENKKYNLTRLDNEKVVYEKYFFASLIPFIDIDLENKNVLDIGSGSGAPGLILKTLYPTMKLTIIESNNKKATFMRNLSDLLGFENVDIISIRAEDTPQDLVEAFDFVTSRAVATLPALLEISAQYLKINGQIVEPKSSTATDEIKNGISHSKKLKLSLHNEIDFEFNSCTYKTFIFVKEAVTPDQYPRMWKDIMKEFKNV